MRNKYNIQELPPELVPVAQQLLEEFESHCRSNTKPKIEIFAARFPREHVRLIINEFIRLENDLCQEDGRSSSSSLDDYVSRLSSEDGAWLRALVSEGEIPRPSDSDVAQEDHSSGKFVQTASFDELNRPDSALGTGSKAVRGGSDAEPRTKGTVVDEPLPTALGRYRVRRIIGQGSFGRVYLADDDQLQRTVAIKVPRSDRISNINDIAAYEAEARMVARLDHPGVVPVYDVGHTEDGNCYVVSKYIEGHSLSDMLAKRRVTYLEAVEITIQIADALAYAHAHDIVHRDVKPANILLEANKRAYLADFGAALADDDFGNGARFVGTPAYMSPEQARGEGHRVEGRSDIFSLGVVFFEMLTGTKPFRGDDVPELLERVAYSDARPPRQIDDNIPPELEQICLKAIANRISERYTTASDLANDLRDYLEYAAEDAVSMHPAERGETDNNHPELAGMGSSRSKSSRRLSASSQRGSTRRKHGSVTDASSDVYPEEEQPLAEPRGLSHYDADDHPFFFKLLPGLRRRGVPDSIRFWTSHVERMVPGSTFPVGVIYGVSGCGKTSFVRAGLLPHLSPSVAHVILDASATSTEKRLERAIRNRCHGLPPGLSLAETIKAIRRGQGIPAGDKLLIVIDQFEQWLHAQRTFVASPLVDALRQCDGTRVQALILVRADFWLATHDFMRQLDITLESNVNSGTIGLFDTSHARNVLVEFGRSHNRLPRQYDQITPEQHAFLDAAVSELADGGDKIVPVHLALFVEMLKHREWTPKTLSHLGGIHGIGVHFLQETFDSGDTAVQYRAVRRPAEAVLQALLPPPGTTIRGAQKSTRELMEAAHLTGRHDDFSSVMKVLVQNLKLVTPASGDDDESSGADSSTNEPCYALTHDYLVPSLRRWFEIKYGRTVRGRAALRLSELTTLWNTAAVDRNLPRFWELVAIQGFTSHRSWTARQRDMIRRAMRRYLARGVVLAVVLGMCSGIGYLFRQERLRRQMQAESLVQRLMDASLAKLPSMFPAMERDQNFVLPKLQAYAQSRTAAREVKRNAHLGLIRLLPDAGDIDFLLEQMLSGATSEEVAAYSNLLRPRKDIVVARLWADVNRPETAPERRLRAIGVLASLDQKNVSWKSERLQSNVAQALCDVELSSVQHWVTIIQPIGTHLVAALRSINSDVSTSIAQRENAVQLLIAFAPESPEMWGELVINSTDVAQFNAFLSKVEDAGEAGRDALREKLREHAAAVDTLHARFTEANDEISDTIELLLNVQLKRSALDDLRIRLYAERNEDQGDIAMEIADVEQRLLAARDEEERMEQHVAGLRDGLQENDQQREWHAKRAAMAGVALIRLAQADEVWPLLEDRPDARVATHIIDLARSMSVSPAEFAARLMRDDENATMPPGQRRSLLLCLCTYPRDQLERSIPDWNAFRAKLETIFRSDAESGVHSAVERLLAHLGEEQVITANVQQWREEALARAPVGPNAPDARWWVNTQGQTMVVIPENPDGFLMGAPLSEKGREMGLNSVVDTFEKQHRRVIDRTFAMATTEVTVEQFRAFDPLHKYQDEVSHDPRCPVNYVTWFDAARYCNWLSSQERIPETEQCYVFTATSAGVTCTLRPNYLNLAGYRLPTEAEWEYACRAGSTTSRFFGAATELLPYFARFEQNSDGRTTERVGTRMPNPWGLYDMYGNVFEWCFDVAREFVNLKPTVPVFDTAPSILTHFQLFTVHDRDRRVFRGGAHDTSGSLIRSATRYRADPTYAYQSLGFRVARTLPK